MAAEVRAEAGRPMLGCGRRQRDEQLFITSTAARRPKQAAPGHLSRSSSWFHRPLAANCNRAALQQGRHSPPLAAIVLVGLLVAVSSLANGEAAGQQQQPARPLPTVIVRGFLVSGEPSFGNVSSRDR